MRHYISLLLENSRNKFKVSIGISMFERMDGVYEVE
jgi:hypothetical protein